MKSISALCAQMTEEGIADLEKNKGWKGELNGETLELSIENFEITTDDIPGWLIANNGSITVALDITLNQELIEEGIAREFVNRVQNLRKDSDFEVTDRITIQLSCDVSIENAIKKNENYIKTETLTDSIIFNNSLDENNATQLDFDKDISIFVSIEKNKLRWQKKRKNKI